MPASLVDSNVWIAAVFPPHPLHGAARTFLENTDPDNSALFCRATEKSFLRLCSTPTLHHAYGVETFTNQDALQLLESLLRLPQVGQREEPPRVQKSWHTLAQLPSASPKVWMDAYLAAFALAGRLKLVTLDHGFRRFEEAGLQLQLLSPTP